jgi:branched-chain amino acid transport system substrate-binding protein
VPIDDDVSRRDFIHWAGKIGFLGVSMLAAGGALSACTEDEKAVAAGSGGGSGFGSGGGGDTLRIGVIAPLSGVGAFVGRIVNTSLGAAVQQVNSTGGIGGRKVEVVTRDTGTDASAGVKAYQALAGDRSVIGVLWCGGLGLQESMAQIQRDNMPVVCVFNDLWSAHNLYPDAPQRSVFQVFMPDRMAFDVLASYCKNDRGYSRAALIYDTLLNGPAKEYFSGAMTKAGLASAGIEAYQLGDSDFGPQLTRLKSAKAQAIMVWGLAGDTAGIVKQLDKLGASYVDTPTARSANEWRPQIMGSPGGTGEHTWADLAGTAAKPGTLTAWHVGGLVYRPSFAIRQWVKKFQGKNTTGGEESPADGMYALLLAVQKAGGTDRQKMVAALETMGPIKFASVPFSFSKDRHLSKTPDDLTVVTLERSTGAARTDPAYELGREWKEVLAPGYVGPVQLVRPTLEANKRAHPDVMELVLRDGWGTQCTKHADGSLGPECKVH